MMRTLEDLILQGQQRRIAKLTPISSDTARSVTFGRAGNFTGSMTIAGRSWSCHRLRQGAVAGIASGKRVSLHLFGPTTLFHRVVFDPCGVSEQRGGVIGKSDRNDPLVQITRLPARTHREIERVQRVRQFTL